MVNNKNKHICVIVSCLLSVMIAITPLFTINNNKTTAKADSVASGDYLVLLPSFYFNYKQEQCVMPSMFFCLESDTQALFYRCSSLDGTKGYYTGFYYLLNKRVQTDTVVEEEIVEKSPPKKMKVLKPGSKKRVKKPFEPSTYLI